MDLAELPIDHVAIAVRSIPDALPAFKALARAGSSETLTVPEQGVRLVFVGSDPKLEILEPLEPDSPVGRFLDKRGPGLHHVAYRTPDIDATLTRLRDAGFRLIDAEPREGAGGHRIAFLHPASCGGVLVELVEG